MHELLLAEGYLNWSRYERVGDRYGTVRLYVKPESEQQVALPLMPVGAIGELWAEVIDPHPSTHIGDMFHGFRQGGPPELGARFLLGGGQLFTDQDEYGPMVGVEPVDGGWRCEPKGSYAGMDEADWRSSGKHNLFWLDPEALYAVHNSGVRLTFVTEEDVKTEPVEIGDPEALKESFLAVMDSMIEDEEVPADRRERFRQMRPLLASMPAERMAASLAHAAPAFMAADGHEFDITRNDDEAARRDEMRTMMGMQAAVLESLGFAVEQP